MKSEVSKDVFYAAMGTKNVHPHMAGMWPYTSEFKTPSDVVKGTIEPVKPFNNGKPSYKYFINHN